MVDYHLGALTAADAVADHFADDDAAGPDGAVDAHVVSGAAYVLLQGGLALPSSSQQTSSSSQHHLAALYPRQAALLCSHSRCSADHESLAAYAAVVAAAACY